MHNDLRRLVAKGLARGGPNNESLPIAADMFELHWNDGIALGAQT
jgi:hypothetical protein